MLLRPFHFGSLKRAGLQVLSQHLTPSPSHRSLRARETALFVMAPSVPTLKLNSGFLIPQLGLGTSGLSGDKATEATDTALDMGYTVSHADAPAHFYYTELLGPFASQLKSPVIANQ